ncbi:MAG: CXXX repeat peptide maturase [Sodaliphilus sp.]
MLKYLIIMLDDTSVSYCHYQNPRTERRLMPLDMLKKAIFFAMKENINIQFVYPDYDLPQEYVDTINTIDHTDIVPAGRKGDVVVCSWDNLPGEGVVALRTTRAELFSRYAEIADALSCRERINVIITDLEKMDESEFESYKTALSTLAERVKALYAEGKSPQLNILTDRMMLSAMNNCNAGWESATLAPDGKFYVCPAFYLEPDGYSVGDLETGLDIKNPQLYQLKYAPICRECDAYHCRRCVWLNRKTTLEVNTPSHKQCVVAHLERNASRNLLASIRTLGQFLPEANIPEINYLDPFDKIDRK